MSGQFFGRAIAGLMLGFPLLSAAWAEGVTLTATSLAPDGEWKSRIAPLFVTATNDGPNRAGQLVVRAGTYQMHYPLDLAQGAQKKVQVWLPTEIGARPVVAFEAAGYGVQIEPDPIDFSRSWGANDTRLILGISDNETDIRAWRTSNSQTLDESSVTVNMRALTQGVKPEDAPDSWLAYQGLDYIVVGDGADRLSNEAVDALQKAVISGKTLVVPTGASAPILSDLRWEGWWPARAGEPVSRIPAWAARFALTNAPITERPLEPLDGEVVLDGFAVMGKRGEGRVLLIAANPFEPGNAQRFAKSEMVRKLATLREMDRDAGRMSLDDVADENMQVKPPSFNLVLIMLVTYILVVGPLNFLVLHKMNRRELIWVTSPMISLVFAGLLFAQVRIPATSGKSSVIVGMATVDPLSEEMMLMGRQRLFFGQAQKEDWNLNGMEALWPISSDNPMAMFIGGQSDVPAELIDTGTLEAKGVTSNALQIRQFAFAQSLPWNPQNLVVERKGGGATLVNRTPFEITRVQIWSGREYMTATGIKAGASVKLSVRKIQEQTATQPKGAFLAIFTPTSGTFGVQNESNVKGELVMAGRLVEVQL
ncbi:MAG TPA: hypothetical protein PLS15_11730 [Fimbriimonadaceae bacterium]|nr:hypothetical protein [Fimbriimonadaceae bacterium]HRE94549.1 hypothetical protein [Fimbriimonadaceae bacterium]